MIMSLRPTPFGSNVPDNAPRRRIAAGGMIKSGRLDVRSGWQFAFGLLAVTLAPAAAILQIRRR
jgi:hypothetical protein